LIEEELFINLRMRKDYKEINHYLLMAKEVNEICKNCVRWQQFNDACWVHWEGKKECSHRAETKDEVDMAKQFLNPVF